MTLIAQISIFVYFLIALLIGLWSATDYTHSKSVFIGVFWPLMLARELYKAFKQVWE